ncbi:MAG: SGNH/GDSL hydrolase family protein [Actinomycetota bacterium]|nr:SGNH/GDSL hydrolase family protein [Actinomycetota bacterium]
MRETTGMAPAPGEDVTVDAPPSRPAWWRTRLVVWLQKLALLAVTTMVCLVLVEVGFRLAGYQPIHAVYSKPELFWTHDELLGWVQQPGVRGEYVGPRPYPVEFRNTVRINSLGLRGPELSDVPAGGRRVLLLGDSQAAGFEVAEEHTYAALVEKQLTADLGSPVQVLNAGVRGYGTDQAYLWYRELGRRLRPNVVVFHASENDPEDDTTLHRMRRPFGKAAFAPQPDGSLELVGYPVPEYPLCSAYRLDARFRMTRIDGARTRAFCWAQVRLADHSAFLTFVASRIEHNRRLVQVLYGLGTPAEQPKPFERSQPASPIPSLADAAPPTTQGSAVPPPPLTTPAPPAPVALDYAHQLTTTLIRKLAGEVRHDGAQFVLLADDADLERLDEAAIAADGIEVIRANEAQDPDPAASRFRNDGHLNELGHRRLAGLLAPRLAEVIRR